MSRQRFRETGFTVGSLPTGPANGITDVPGVSVGHVTLIEEREGVSVRTGVTAILPHQGNPFRNKVAAASYVINGFGKTTGLVQVDELGVLESPIMLTDTFGVPAATEGALRYMMELDEGVGAEAGSINIVTGECNDKFLNDMRGLHVRPEHAVEAIREAKAAHDAGRPAAEGAVGAGTGMVCYGWKGGIGTSSRVVEAEGSVYHIGVLTLTNFGKQEDLTVLGQPIGRLLQEREAEGRNDDGSVIIVIGTDLPLDARQLKRLAKRASFGLANTGAIAHHGSGDIVIAFSNGNLVPHEPQSDFVPMRTVREDGALISACFRAVVEAVEEAVYNSLFAGESMTGHQGRTVRGLPVKETAELLRSRLLL
ncbi:P1 family peptidase [Paenibacillus thailandensis]|uniref:P1 family peptidase n=1 Tax=Paenibacillus thailandensis TaxID=393250 RepID=A0ABW5QV04_9BACL